ncbi:cation diffusion facilitator family transporter [Agarilytica rhodophyticola]|uniref:cation diffusion facilitator family transporter n=1 Tax=Agarilytica rhodophyticola TaxID=1737490 RepID=UPI000B347348|nr:cation diffusion facilitator family transporter [Agarilytica rhodophyticola]
MIIDKRIRTSLLAIAADLSLTFVKLLLAVVTGSSVILADAFHSLTDLLVSLVLLSSIVVKISQERRNSQLGIAVAHRLESCLSILVAVVILYLPFEIINEAQQEKEAISNIWLGIIGMTAVISVVAYMSHLKICTGRDTSSPALEADGYHSLVDVFTSIAVLLSLVCHVFGVYLDSAIAIIIAMVIGFSGVQLLLAAVKDFINSEALAKTVAKSECSQSTV